MKFQAFVTPATLLVAGAFSGAAHASVVVDTTGWDATYGGTPITLAGSSLSQYTFGLADYTFPIFFTKTTLSGNNGATVSAPGESTFNSQVDTNGLFGPSPGDYGLQFSANGVQYMGTATVDDTGNHISQISYDVASVPEPATWAMMVLGLGLAGGALRRSRRDQLALAKA
jgi:hypothetical protein